MNIHIGKNGQQLGPYETAALITLVKGGEISLTDLAWSEGEPAWLPLSEYAKKKGLVLIPLDNVNVLSASSIKSETASESNASFREIAERAADLAVASGAALATLAEQAKTVVVPLGTSLIEKAKETVNQARSQAEPQQTGGEGNLDQDLRSSEMHIPTTPSATKSVVLAYILLFCMGSVGAHRFYLGKKSSAFGMLGLTLGGTLLAVIGGFGDISLLAGLGSFMLIGMMLWCVADIFMIPKIAKG